MGQIENKNSSAGNANNMLQSAQRNGSKYSDMNFNNLDDIDEYSNGVDHGFDPPGLPQKMDSGRGGTASMTGGAYNRNGDGAQL